MEAIDGYVTKLRTMSHGARVSGQGSVLKPSMGHPVRLSTLPNKPSFCCAENKGLCLSIAGARASVQNNALRDEAEPDEARGPELERATAPWCTVSPVSTRSGDSTQDPPPG
ncbi:hypothetical protein AAFF_G00198840 [Aldrovandia affinis]|uniref:Uncharacterized protein n=1 Tax=Aldrovandia affinis TaxID=143900 RepID=A0AAD7R022_9TELE|nr:hypothetical protein AAFF_G00198840 [Aldrovandia affinis]